MPLSPIRSQRQLMNTRASFIFHMRVLARGKQCIAVIGTKLKTLLRECEWMFGKTMLILNIQK